MRDAVNNNPLVQVAVLGVLLLGAGFFLLSSTGGREEEEPASAGAEAGATSPEAAVEIAVGEGEAGAAVEPPPGALAEAAPPPPAELTEAFEAGRTVVLLFVRNGGIDDELVTASVRRLSGLPGVSPFVVPAGRIARYTAIAQGVDVERVPALVVVRPKRVAGGAPTATIAYGFQSPQSVVQAVVDAGYEGPSVDYHP